MSKTPKENSLPESKHAQQEHQCHCQGRCRVCRCRHEAEAKDKI